MNTDVARELEESQRTLGKDEGLLKYLNNFRFHLPEGWYRDLASDCWDVPYIRLGSTAHFSPKKNQQTPEEFYKTIDCALAAEGIVIPLSLQSAIRAKDLFFFGIRAQMVELYTLVLPGYAHLRDDGYNHADLTA